MFKKLLCGICVITFISLTGCATVRHVPLQQQNKAALNKTYVDNKISKPNGMYLMGSSGHYGMAFGVIGALAGASADQKSAKETIQLAEKNHIDISDIVYQQWLKQLGKNPQVKLTSNNQDGVVLKTDIVLYGLTISNGFSTYYKPMLALRAKLMRNNQVLWQDSTQLVSLSGGLPSYKWDEIQADPNKLYMMWNKASERLVGNLIRDMMTA